jgi:two-component system nitrogen regulation response regulator NtrX
VRELRNVIEQAAVLASGEAIEAGDLRLGSDAITPEALHTTSSLPFGEAKRQTVSGFERSYLLAALRRHGGNISRTAEAIGMVRQSLQQKIRELGLRSEDWGGGEPNEGERR